jgi:hypothetical protein
MKNANHRQEKKSNVSSHTHNKETLQLYPSAEDYGQTQAVKEDLFGILGTAVMSLGVALLATAATTRFICKLFFICSKEAHYCYMLLNLYVVFSSWLVYGKVLLGSYICNPLFLFLSCQ